MYHIHDLTYRMVCACTSSMVMALAKTVYKIDFYRVDKSIADAVSVSIIPEFTLGEIIAFAVEEAEKS